MNLDDLKPAPYNPRRIHAEALAALGRSIAEFGDISGIVWNRATGFLVAGHQRLAALKKLHGDAVALVGEPGDGLAVVAPDGSRLPVRVVDWEPEKEQLANLTANNPHITGEFDIPGVERILDGIDADDILAPLRLDLLIPPVPFADHGGEWGGMPEFQQEDQTAVRSLKVNFATLDDVGAFASLVGQTITDKTISIWFPKRDTEPQTTHEYGDDQA